MSERPNRTRVLLKKGTFTASRTRAGNFSFVAAFALMACGWSAQDSGQASKPVCEPQAYTCDDDSQVYQCSQLAPAPADDCRAFALRNAELSAIWCCQ